MFRNHSNIVFWWTDGNVSGKIMFGCKKKHKMTIITGTHRSLFFSPDKKSEESSATYGCHRGLQFLLPSRSTILKRVFFVLKVARWLLYLQTSYLHPKREEMQEGERGAVKGLKGHAI